MYNSSQNCPHRVYSSKLEKKSQICKIYDCWTFSKTCFQKILHCCQIFPLRFCCRRKFPHNWDKTKVSHYICPPKLVQNFIPAFKCFWVSQTLKKIKAPFVVNTFITYIYKMCIEKLSNEEKHSKKSS